MDIIKRLREIKEENGITFREWEKQSGITKGAAIKILRNISPNVGVLTIDKLLAPLGYELTIKKKEG